MFTLIFSNPVLITVNQLHILQVQKLFMFFKQIYKVKSPIIIEIVIQMFIFEYMYTQFFHSFIHRDEQGQRFVYVYRMVMCNAVGFELPVL
jgi:hypothetical protein